VALRKVLQLRCLSMGYSFHGKSKYGLTYAQVNRTLLVFVETLFVFGLKTRRNGRWELAQKADQCITVIYDVNFEIRFIK
jgi:hypothetical protein